MSVDGPPASGSYPQPVSPSLVGQVLDGRYRIIKLIGEGGMGEVYSAEHVHIDKRFAIKLLKPEIVSNAEAVTRFRQEARSSSSIGHRNIIAIEDFGSLQDGRIYMCMELLNGAALNDMIQQPMGADRLLNILIQTGHGLAAAHAKGIVHRDMKPENIFVTIDAQGQDVPKILDFGIAKVSGNDGGNHLTRTGTIFGTPFYMAPEQALGNPVDARTDIYAMGVIMYECFAGSLPFQGESFMGILTQHITSEPEPVAQRAAKAGRALPMGLADIITRCMQKDPARRFSSMDELVNALIAVYRGIAGPGMSTYMEAFPVGSMQHKAQPTPSPMTGPMSGPMTGGMVATPHAATASAGMPPQYQQPPVGQMGSGPVGMVSAASSGMYDPAGSVVVPKKSKAGLVIAIFAVLAVGGGIAAFMLLSKDTKESKGTDSGPPVATNDPGSGSQQGKTTDHGGGSGSQVAATGSAHAGANDPWLGGSSDPGTAAGSAHGTDQTTNPGSGATGSGTTGPAPIGVFVMTQPELEDFEIWENGAKLQDGNDELPVTKGTPRTVMVKAKGFKDKTITITGEHKRFIVKLEAAAGATHVTHNPTTHNPTNPTNPEPNTTQPPKKDCSAKILDAHDKRCISQYCGRHSDDVSCAAE